MRPPLPAAPPMLPLLLAASLSSLAPFAPEPLRSLASPVRATSIVSSIDTAPIGDGKPIKALEAWLKLYHAGKIDYTSKDNMAKDSLAMKYKVAPRSALTDPTWAGDLELILEALAAQNDEEAAAALLEVAAIGIDQGKYTPEMAPATVRGAAERWIAKLSSTGAKAALGKAARGELKVSRAQKVAIRAAAARSIALVGDRLLLSELEPLLQDEAAIVRVNAAEAFGKLADESKAGPLIELLRRDASDAVLQTAAEALRAIYKPFALAGTGSDAEAGTAKLPESLRQAVRAAIEALGRTSWRADMALVRFLDDFRSLEAVPALIAVLERFRDHPDQLEEGKLSGLLRYQVHELLVSTTGAVLPADQPERWRALWDAEKDKLEVTKKHETGSAGATTAGDFFGIPIEGTRVVFVLDLSGSMQWPVANDDGSGRKERQSGLDFAKQELRRAIAALPPNAQCNLITFNGNPRPELWSKDLVPATERNRDRLLKHVDGLRADGGTNLWGALEEALKIRSLVQNAKYETDIDELFVLSDGAPSAGAVIDPVQILRLVQESNRFAATRINTVFVNTELPPEARRAMAQMEMQPAELMKRLAEQNSGRFREL